MYLKIYKNINDLINLYFILIVSFKLSHIISYFISVPRLVESDEMH